MGSSDTPITLLMFGVVLYILMQLGIFKPEKEKKPVSTAVTAACPRGKAYSRGWFPGDNLCDPGYLDTFNPLKYGLNPTCECIVVEPTSVPDAGNSPQTPAPTYLNPDFCPSDASILKGDSRCKPLAKYKESYLEYCPEGQYLDISTPYPQCMPYPHTAPAPSPQTPIPSKPVVETREPSAWEWFSASCSVPWQYHDKYKPSPGYGLPTNQNYCWKVT